MTNLSNAIIETANRRHKKDETRSPTCPWDTPLTSIRGRIRDCDSHLTLGPDETLEILGDELGGPIYEKRKRQFEKLDGFAPLIKDGTSVWGMKGIMAYGAGDAKQRLEILDEMGVKQQILFGSGMSSVFWASSKLAYPAARRFNEFASAWSEPDRDRLRPAAIICCQDPDKAIAEAIHAIKLGLKAVQLSFYPDFPHDPGDKAWRPFWSLLNEEKIPALLHWDMRWNLIENAGHASKIHLRSGKSLVETRRGLRDVDLEAALPNEMHSSNDDFAIMTAHHTPEKFLTSLALSGVFEQNPDLRIGVFECTSFWVGPWLERLDELQQTIPGLSSNRTRLSDVIKNALRITPLYAEPFVQHALTHGLEDIFVFGTDFPHPEGGIQPLQEIAAQATGNNELFDKIFRKNAESIFP